MKICIQDFQELLYRALKIERSSRDLGRLKDPDYISDLENDPELQTVNINPRSIDPRKQGRSVYPNLTILGKGGVMKEPKAMQNFARLSIRETETCYQDANKITEIIYLRSSGEQTLLLQYLDARAATDARS